MARKKTASAPEPEYIRLHTEGENFWAIALDDHIAEVANVLLSPAYSLGDIVRWEERNGHREVVKLIKQARRTTGIRYTAGQTEQEIQTNYQAVVEALLPHNIHVEGAVPGMALIAFPAAMNDKQLNAILKPLKKMGIERMSA